MARLRFELWSTPMSVLPLRRSRDDAPVDPADINLHDHDPEFARLDALRQKLSARLVELDNQIIPGLVRHLKAAAGPRNSKPGLKPQIAALLGRQPEEGAVEGLENQLAEAEHERRDLREALNELDPQLFQAHSRASYAACQQLKPRHDRLVDAMATAMHGLGKAQDDLCRFYDELDAANIQRGSLPTQLIPSQACGGKGEWEQDRARRQTFVDRWFQYAKRCGFNVKE